MFIEEYLWGGASVDEVNTRTLVRVITWQIIVLASLVDGFVWGILCYLLVCWCASWAVRIHYLREDSRAFVMIVVMIICIICVNCWLVPSFFAVFMCVGGPIFYYFGKIVVGNKILQEDNELGDKYIIVMLYCALCLNVCVCNYSAKLFA